MHSREECTVLLNNGCFTPVVFSAYGALPVDGSVWSSFADVEGVTSVGHQLRVPSYSSLQDKMVSRLDWVQTSEQTYQPNILLSSTNLFIGGWWREDFAWWRVRWWRDRSLVASLLGGEVTGYLTGDPSSRLEKKPTINSIHALCDSVLSYERNRWKFEHVIRNSIGIEIWSIYNDKYFEIITFFL